MGRSWQSQTDLRDVSRSEWIHHNDCRILTMTGIDKPKDLKSIRWKDQTDGGLSSPQRYVSSSAILVAIASFKQFGAYFHGVSHNDCATCCQMGCRTDVPV